MYNWVDAPLLRECLIKECNKAKKNAKKNTIKGFWITIKNFWTKICVLNTFTQMNLNNKNIINTSQWRLSNSSFDLHVGDYLYYKMTPDERRSKIKKWKTCKK